MPEYFDSITDPHHPSHRLFPTIAPTVSRRRFVFVYPASISRGSGVDFCIENQLSQFCLLGRRRGLSLLHPRFPPYYISARAVTQAGVPRSVKEKNLKDDYKEGNEYERVKNVFFLF